MNLISKIALLCLIPLQLIRGAENEFELTQCLGQEEKLIHEAKDHGPTYQINQMLLSIFISIKAITIKKEFFQNICSPPRIGSSTDLLELIFKHYENLFLINSGKQTKAADSDSLEELFRKLPELFNQYMLEINNKSPSANCLENHISELKEFQTQVQYLGQDILFRSIAEKNHQLVKIIDKLKNKDEIFKLCSEELTKAKDKK